MSSKNLIGCLAFFLCVSGLCIFAGNAGAQTPPVKQTELETKIIALNYCVKFNFEKREYIFNDLQALSSSLANYENARDCRPLIKEIDFSKYTLLGVDIYNAECQKFPMTHKVIKDEAAKLYRFQVTHPPVSVPCRGMYHHELWILAPKMPDEYRVVFEIKEKFPDETEVPVLRRTGSRYSRCYTENTVYTEESFNKLVAGSKDCSDLPSLLKPDFKKQTLIGFHLGGDCFMRAAAKVVRSDKEKIFTVRIKNIWGGCRAGGSFNGWLLVDKIPADYRVRFSKTRVEKYLDGDGTGAEEVFELLPKQTPVFLETREIDLKGCVSLRFKAYQSVISDNDTFLKAIRNDASRDRCLKDIEKIDFSRHTLLGVNINSGYCRRPVGLEYKTVKDEAKKLYTLQVSYAGPHGVCRAMSSYDLWVLVPKMPDGYEAVFEVKAVDGKEEP